MLVYVQPHVISASNCDWLWSSKQKSSLNGAGKPVNKPLDNTASLGFNHFRSKFKKKFKTTTQEITNLKMVTESSCQAKLSGARSKKWILLLVIIKICFTHKLIHKNFHPLHFNVFPYFGNFSNALWALTNAKSNFRNIAGTWRAKVKCSRLYHKRGCNHRDS